MEKQQQDIRPGHLVSVWAYIDNQEPNTELWVTHNDKTKLNGRGRGLRTVAKDYKSGKTYKLYGASCGLPNCMCALRTTEAK